MKYNYFCCVVSCRCCVHACCWIPIGQYGNGDIPSTVTINSVCKSIQLITSRIQQEIRYDLSKCAYSGPFQVYITRRSQGFLQNIHYVSFLIRKVPSALTVPACSTYMDFATTVINRVKSITTKQNPL